MKTLIEVLEHKRALLKVAQAKVAELQNQILMLERIISEDDAVDEALAEKAFPEEPDMTPGILMPYVPEATAGGRNPKGIVDAVLVSILSDKVERDLDYIEESQKSRLPNPLNRAALRTRLMMLKDKGIIESRRQGYFQLA